MNNDCHSEWSSDDYRNVVEESPSVGLLTCEGLYPLDATRTYSWRSFDYVLQQQSDSIPRMTPDRQNDIVFYNNGCHGAVPAHRRGAEGVPKIRGERSRIHLPELAY